MTAIKLFNYLIYVVIGCIYFGGLVAEYFPLRYALFFVSIFSICCLVAHVYRSAAFTGPLGLVIVAVMVFGLFRSGALSLTPGESDRTFRFFVLFPTVFILGYFISRAQTARSLETPIIAFSTISAVIAVAERASGSRIISSEAFSADLARGGAIRAAALTEQPLVLASLLTVCASLLLFRIRRFRFDSGGELRPEDVLILILVFGGIWATGSRGALLALLFVSAIVFLFSRGTSTLQAAKSFGFVATLLTVLVLALYSYRAFLSGRVLQSLSADGASAEYRRVIYGYGIDSLLLKPLGWGVSDLPKGKYLIPSRFGIIDMSTTIDSEYVRAAIDFGVIGIFLLLASVYLGFRSFRLGGPVGIICVALLSCGTFVSLHSWASVGTLLFLLAGSCFGFKSVVRHRPSMVPADADHMRSSETSSYKALRRT